MALESCPYCLLAFEMPRRGARAEERTVDAHGVLWRIVTSDRWVVHQCTISSAAAPGGARVDQHAMPSSVIAVLVVAGIVGFVILTLWAARTP